MKEEKKEHNCIQWQRRKKINRKAYQVGPKSKDNQMHNARRERKRGREIISNMLWPNNEQLRMEDMRMGDKQKADLENKSLNKEQQRETVKIFLFALFFGLPWNVYVFFVYIAFA